ncbi:hypothetical protein [Histidinibacterium aquaticum]|uniref:Glycerophosphoryl diester phosphodiesterase membrane domain-containing protein n=1 Tax=Histidinibacterium aquaticum TaxID=2613962 RepID=A0A5J5GFV3_9RHOB|nr:hypothetical protein [Histidinibacterium aquaticum]KAA9006890.1 hypothetical protein F3S47_14045 [Histidinibacterium aquaticum]
MAVQILRHAILMVLNNLGDALKATLAPLVAGAVAVMLLFAVLGIDVEALSALSGPGGDPLAQEDLPPEALQNVGSLMIFLLLAALISILCFSWAAVVWHRFILLEEYPPALPSPSGKPVGAYLWRSLLVAILLIVVMIPVSLIGGLLLGPLLAGSPVLATAVFSTVFGVLASYLWLRWAMVLPAVAVGRGLTIRDSWKATGRLGSTILGVSVLTILLNLVLGLLAVPFGASFVALLVNIVVSWFTALVGLSILTTLYGHLIEDRPLVE